MLKFIIISIIGFYLLFKVVGLLLRTLLTMMGSSIPKGYHQKGNYNSNRADRRPAPDSNLNVDYIPKAKKSKNEFTGGEYVDYEEVK